MIKKFFSRIKRVSNLLTVEKKLDSPRPDSSYLPLPDFIVDFWESMGNGLGVVFNAFGVSGGPALVHTAVLVMGVWASVYIVMKAAVNWKVTFFVLLLIQTLVAFV